MHISVFLLVVVLVLFGCKASKSTKSESESSPIIQIEVNNGVEKSVDRVACEYEPTVSTISGTIAYIVLSNPILDNSYHSNLDHFFVINLDIPIDMIGQEHYIGQYNDTKRNVSSIQLSENSGIDFSRYINQRVTIRGTLYGSFANFHYRDVLVNVIEIVEG